MERKLAAIVAGDIVGYSRLMAEDETATYADLRSAFDEVVRPVFERHKGRIFKNTGDGFLAAFPSVNEALDAAVDIQDGFAKLPLKLRIGLNLGDVIIEDGDVFGDGVNVAARLETMAEPGSIYVSAAVVRSADRNRDQYFQRIGLRKAKNIPDAIDVYVVRPKQRDLGATVGWVQRIAPTGRRAILACAGGLAAIAVVAATVPENQWLSDMRGRIAPSLAWFSGVQSADARPSVAVLPFDNMSGDDGQNYFADGLTEDIITELARNAELQVIARNSSFAFRGQAVDIREIGARLGAAYIVEGSARREGDQLRVVAQLIDTRNGAHLWSRSYDRRVEDVFAVQTDLTSEIVAHLVSYVRESEVAEASDQPTENLQAYDLVLQARDRYKHGSSDGADLLASRALYQRALELDPAYAAARAYLGMTYIVDFVQGVSGRATQTDVDVGLSEARQSIRLSPNLPIGYQVLSFGLSAKGDYEESMRAARQSVELNPNDPDSLMALAKAQVRFGDYEDAVANAERARRLHPMAPEYYVYVHGQALYAAGRVTEAETVLAECLLRAPADSNCLLILAAVQVNQGELGEARTTMARLLDANPKFSLMAERDYRRFGNSPLMERFLSELAQAEAPETAERLNRERKRAA
ncbi:adenylate/guanylate cyclase domain-containing protein [Allomesorhizobium alhagi]|jgi:adenylate cyclase|uniref:Adenylate/guanylate cyclase n=1 Tax=Mesorhizobium alhagi CCNWXJ12-2 TaxID=1107882 RepID=H0HPU7_9HYPH|nr:adenylate/guanylate cyclase domain-containing protein [Mesorhizobium alhagi]EHK57214.1 adenylate/guanylate cyclase [Mesorhizobium alhagi CCNWXJ12-2]